MQIIRVKFVLSGRRRLTLKSATGLSYLPILMSICPASNREQAIARVGRQWAWGLRYSGQNKLAAMRQYEPRRPEEPGRFVIRKMYILSGIISKLISVSSEKLSEVDTRWRNNNSW